MKRLLPGAVVAISAAGILAAVIYLILQQTVLAGNPALTSFVIQYQASLRYRQIETPQGTAYVMTVPATAPFAVLPAVIEEGMATVPQFAERTGAAAVINGGFFDPSNGETISHVSIGGKPVLDPTTNRRLTDNPGLKKYLSAFFNRSEFRVYECPKPASTPPELARALTYDITPHNAPLMAGCTLAASLGAGPALLPQKNLDRQMMTEAVIDRDISGKIIRNPLGVDRPDARSVVGITAKGDVILLMLAQSPKTTGGRGFTLEEAAEMLSGFGAVKGLALDGGSSSGLYAEKAFHAGKFDKAGEPMVRRVKSVLSVMPRPR